MKTRMHGNYRAAFLPSGKTIHWKVDPDQPYEELEYPELYDIAINNRCAGRCPYCYISSVPEGVNYKHIVTKALRFFGKMTRNQRPFQVAIGGAGEPTMHPEFPKFLLTMRLLGIVPNYTTNGMHLPDSVLDATEAWAGGVAVTVHNHLEKHWRKAIEKLHAITRLNLHFIPMNVQDVDRMIDLSVEYLDEIDYFVILPYQAIGFGKPIDTASIYEYMFNRLKNLPHLQRFAFGAMFYDELLRRPWLNADLYGHSLFSKYLDMQGSMTLFKSSYEWETPLRENLLESPRIDAMAF